MGFHIDFCTNVMSALVMSSLPLLCADLRFGLPPASPLPQSPIRHSFSLLLDFLTSPLRFKVQSDALSCSFWTSVHHPATLKSNLPLFLAPFGLPRISPLPQSPIRRSFSPLLDFLMPPLRFKVQSTTLARPTTQKRRIATQSANSNPPVAIRQSHSNQFNQPA